MAMERRLFLAGVMAGTVPGVAGAAIGVTLGGPDLRQAIADCERRSGGRLGVAVQDVKAGTGFAWRGDERFPMCSTFKFLLAAAVLRRVDAGKERLDRRLAVSAADMLSHAPFTTQRVGRDASIEELCHATMTLSDNPAANLLLATMGGPAGLTRFIRSTGDRITRTDRTEPALNSAIPGDPRDTTSPDAMVGTLNRLLLGSVLQPASRRRLTGWMIANTTGNARLRAGLPDGWRIGDKTGSDGRGTTNDIAILWPTGDRPVLVACYLTGATLDGDGQNAIHRQVGAAVARALTSGRR